MASRKYEVTDSDFGLLFRYLDLYILKEETTKRIEKRKPISNGNPIFLSV